jgi:hypothetical protein
MIENDVSGTDTNIEKELKLCVVINKRRKKCGS